jgi:predicted O-methyltransferase YrrM
MDAYEFTEDWFSHVAPTWRPLLEGINPSKILEIGSYEGRSTCFLIEAVGARRGYDIYCVDPWTRSASHNVPMDLVEKRFDANVALAAARTANKGRVTKMKGSSIDLLPAMLPGHKGTFDLVYVDGSHEAHDVLLDAVLGFHLCRPGGLLIFDDYLWSPDYQTRDNPLKTPKPAIDAFVNTFRRQLRIVEKTPLYQLYLQKLGAADA